jgi:hypothetical protein
VCACKTPIIITDRCFISKLTNGNLGYVIPFEKKLLKNAIIKMINDEDFRYEEIIKNSKTLPMFDNNNCCNQLVILYENCVNNV